MKLIVLGILGSLIAQISTSNSALAQNIITYGGSGCPQGSLRTTISANKASNLPDLITLYFTKPYRAVQGKNILITERRKNCNLAINLNVPQGYQYSVSQVEYAGFANLPSGVTGVQSTTLAFPFSNSATVETVLNGPDRNTYQSTNNSVPNPRVWSQCGKILPLNIRTSLTLKGSNTPAAEISARQLANNVTQRYRLQWRKCS